jgi:hypothetical protein
MEGRALALLRSEEGTDNTTRANGRASRAARADGAMADLALATTSRSGPIARCSSLKHCAAFFRQNQVVTLYKRSSSHLILPFLLKDYGD